MGRIKSAVVVTGWLENDRSICSMLLNEINFFLASVNFFSPVHNLCKQFGPWSGMDPII